MSDSSLAAIRPPTESNHPAIGGYSTGDPGNVVVYAARCDQPALPTLRYSASPEYGAVRHIQGTVRVS